MLKRTGKLEISKENVKVFTLQQLLLPISCIQHKHSLGCVDFQEVQLTPLTGRIF